MELYSWAKALHLVSIVSWFAGLFYLVRLFVYHAEARQKSAAEQAILLPQYTLMEKRLWRAIVIPAMIGTTIFGLYLAYLIKAWTQPWFLVKLGFLIPQFAYHDLCGRLRRQLAEENCHWSSKSFRILNEGATILLFAIVFTVVFKRPMGAIYGLSSVLILGVLGMSVFVFARRKKS